MGWAKFRITSAAGELEPHFKKAAPSPSPLDNSSPCAWTSGSNCKKVSNIFFSSFSVSGFQTIGWWDARTYNQRVF